jgi:hypothetical protein
VTSLWGMFITASQNAALQICKASPTYRPQIGFLCFIDVVVQGGEVVTRLHLVALPSNHVRLTGALARLSWAATGEEEQVSCARHMHK